MANTVKVALTDLTQSVLDALAARIEGCASGPDMYQWLARHGLDESATPQQVLSAVAVDLKDPHHEAPPPVNDTPADRPASNRPAPAATDPGGAADPAA